ncbi:MAG: phosphoenolpyruvate--protein phosphotransferase [Spirochaetales bacterium]|nr:phosphoenolpyruvate--protein phosphotransferase [Spirochaetales bacterium]
MREYHGIPASPGIAIHRAFNHNADAVSIPHYSISELDVESEWERYTLATARAAEEIRSIKSSLDTTHTDQHQLLDAQLLMLHDPEMGAQIKGRLPQALLNVEWVLTEYIENMVGILEASGDEYLAERSMDILDVSRRITNQLLFREKQSLREIHDEVILVSPNLLPSETIQLDPHKVRGIALDAGGRTSHTAILARSFGIPAVLGLRGICRKIKPGEIILIDGDTGTVIVSPDHKTLLRYEKKLKSREESQKRIDGLRDLPAESTDGHSLSLLANIEIPGEVNLALRVNASGVGLFRSEFLFMDPDLQPDEERQYLAYKEVLEAMGGRPVTIRTLDVGGDKLLPTMDEGDELNPLLGWRAIRFCLEEEELFRTQLRALLRASVHGELRVMFPLISNISELEDALALLEDERKQLKSEGYSIADSMPVGIMIEVPSAALIADSLATKVDFFSVGTNDLIQYTMAVDRGNEKIAPLYQPYHPALWKLVKMAADAAHRAGIPIGVCGEVAGDPALAVLLLAMGVQELSMGAFSIPAVKRIIRSVSAVEAQGILDEVMGMACAEDAEERLHNWLGERL